MLPEIHEGILNGWRVLIVEDDPFSLDVATIMLTHYGAEVLTATNGAEGLETARKARPDFIISDISMPGMDGWMMIETLKKDRTISEIPVIALSAHAMKGNREKAIASGFHNYLTKPLTPETFISDLLILLVDIPSFEHALQHGK